MLAEMKTMYTQQNPNCVNTSKVMTNILQEKERTSNSVNVST